MLRVETLDQRHDRQNFDCGVDALDRYIKTQASQDMRRRVATCFVCVDQHPMLLGFHTLSATVIALSDLPKALSQQLPRYPALPATLIGRLAVDRRHRGKGIGEYLLLDALSRALRNEIASFAVVVDAKDEAAIGFYSAYDFRPLGGMGRMMFIPMAEVARLFA